MLTCKLSPAPWRATLAAFALLTACGDDAQGSDETGGASSTGADTVAMTGTPDTGSVDSTGVGSETTAAQTDSSSGGDPGSSSGSAETGSTTGSMADGTCLGLDQVGSLDIVLGLDGANPGGNCDPEPMGCGGDLVGAWDFSNNCGADQIPGEIACDEYTYSVEIVDQTGTITFVDDNTFTQDSITTTMVDLSLDATVCFGINCAAYEAQLQGSNPGWSCTFNDPSCDCTLMDMNATDASGTWATSGNVMTLTSNGLDVDFEYCVSNDRLDLWQGILDATPTKEMCVDETDCEAALGNAHEAYVCLPAAG